MSDERMTLFELKEKAKWSSDLEEKKAAVKKLSNRGENAISELQEIMNITAYEDIKNACAEAIKSIQARSDDDVVVEVHSTSSSTTTTTTTTDSSNNNNSVSDDVVMTKDQKKEKLEKEEAKSA